MKSGRVHGFRNPVKHGKKARSNRGQTHLLLEAHLQQPVRLVQDQHGKVLEAKGLGEVN